MARLLVWKETRNRWRSLVLLGLLTTIWAATTMSAVAGSRRTASVVDRFQHATSTSDATFAIAGDTSGELLYRALSSQPEVVSSDVVWSAGTGLAFDDGVFVNLIGGASGIWSRDFDKPIIESGRLADPSDPSEVMITANVADLLDVEAGDHIAIPTWDKQDWNAWLLVRGNYPAFDGPLIDVAIVGVVRLTFDLEINQEASLVIVATPAFLDRWGPEIGNNDAQVVVQLRDPEGDTPRLALALTESLGQPVIASTADDIYAANLRDATGTLTVGVGALAAAVGVTGALIVGFGITREVRAMAVRQQPLRALGATPRQRAIVLSTPIGLTAVGSAIIAVIVAVFASALFPFGSGRLAEPERGMAIDVPVLAGSALVIVFMLVISAHASLQSAPTRSEGETRLKRRPALTRRLGPATTVGFTNAIGRRWSKATIFACAITIAGLVASGWFARSLEELSDAPERWGYTWSASPDLGFAAAEFPAAVRALLADPAIEGVGRLESASASIRDRNVEISTLRIEGGHIAQPRVLAGRLPVADTEIALGQRAARVLGAGVGDTVLVASADEPPSEWQVVGIVVPPNLLTTRNPGDGAFATPHGHEELFTSPEARIVISYRPGVDRQLVESQLMADPGWVFGARSHARHPAAVANFVGVSVITVWLGGFFLVLGSAATMLSSCRDLAQQRDLDTLRALGFTRGGVRRCVVAEHGTVVMIGSGAGMAVGLLAGRVAWGLATRNLGVIDVSASPLPVLLGVGVLCSGGGIVASVLSFRQATTAVTPRTISDA